MPSNCTCVVCGATFEWWNAKATHCPQHRPKERARVMVIGGKSYFVPTLAGLKS